MQQKKKHRQLKKHKQPKQNKKRVFKCYADLQEWVLSTRAKLVANMTPSEKKVRACLLANHIEYKQQHFIRHGDNYYFADFMLPEHNVVIEVDGGYHNEPQQKIDDRKRQKNIEKEGFKVMRIKNEDTLFTDNILAAITNFINNIN